MKSINYSLLFILACLNSAAANAAGSALRVTCEGDDVGAEVLINGKFKGECPLDIQVPAGKIKLLVQKKIGDKDYLFEQEIRMGDGVSKKVEAKLIDKQFFENLKQAEAGNEVAMIRVTTTYLIEIAKGRGDKKYNQEQLFKWNRKLADTGHGGAMISLGDAYEKGEGVEIDKVEADRWYKQGLMITRKEAEGGNNNSMAVLGIAYMVGRGVTQDRAIGLMWIHKAKDAGYDDADYLLKTFEEK